MIGKRLLHYDVIDKLGEGGMGEVYRARDTQLGRDVAIKVLPETFADDPERLARFRREAQLLASLNHPNIAAIYGIDEAEGRRFLAMELVEGETLADRLSRGAVPLDEAVPIARQIAEALEEAHEKGIVHRDLKPGNVQLTPDGRVKVLDFGLGKLVDPFLDDATSDLTQSPTVTAMTGAHVILGTAAYMSPEQAKGKAVSWRADIWSFGVIVFEMVTGRRLFEGETVSETLASVMKDNVPWSSLPERMPALLQDLLRRCLERNPRQRLQSIGDARIALQELESGSASGSVIGVAAGAQHETAGAPPARGSGMRRAIPWIVAGAAIVLSAVVWTSRSPDHSASTVVPLRKFTLDVGSVSSGRRSAILSPDGRRVAYTADGSLWVRDLDRLEPRELVPNIVVDDQLELVPLWSPDGSMIAYPSGSMLNKVSADGGSGALICGVTEGFMGGAWLEDGTIVYASPRGPMYSVPASGGDPKVIIPLRPEEDVDFHEPSPLPGGGFIYSVHHARAVDTVEMFRDGERHELFHIPAQHSRNPQVVNFPAWSPSGHIVYRRDQGTIGLWAVPFDLRAGKVTGDPILISGDGSQPSISSDGTMLYVRGASVSLARMVWVGLDGTQLGEVGEPVRGLATPVLSPDGDRIAYAADNSGDGELWVHDLRRDTRTRLTFTTEDESEPQWVPGEDALLYIRWSPEGPAVWSISASGAGQAQPVAEDVIDFDISPDGTTLILLREEGRKASLFLHPRGGGEDRVIEEAANVILRYPRFSPDGKYITYLSWENRSPSTYIKELDGPGRWLVPGSYESQVQWDPDGHTLFYNTREGESVMNSVSVETSPVFKLGPRIERFKTSGPGYFDVGPEGDRLLLVEPAEAQDDDESVAVVQNWWSEFAR